MQLCINYNILRRLADDIILELFDYTSLPQEEIASVGEVEYMPKINEQVQDLECNKSYKWTHFTINQLNQLEANRLKLYTQLLRLWSNHTDAFKEDIWRKAA